MLSRALWIDIALIAAIAAGLWHVFIAEDTARERQVIVDEAAAIEGQLRIVLP